jgi:hypothetical protein
MKKRDDNRDEELDLLLSPLRGDDPGPVAKEKWIRDIEKKRLSSRFSLVGNRRRYLEWAVAASVGFVVAIQAMKQFDSTARVVNLEQKNFGIDATEMQLFAKSD